MRGLRGWFVRLGAVLRPGSRDRELADELNGHLDLAIEEYVRHGFRPDEARRRALIDLGGLAPTEERYRERQTFGPLASVARDARFSFRLLWRSPGFAAAAVLTLGLGIGATTAIFSVVYGVLLKPLPFQEPERLVGLFHNSPDGGRNQGPATYFTYRDNQWVFEDIGAWDRGQVTITGGEKPEQIDVLRVSDAMLPLLRVQPLLGRPFSKEDDAPGRPLRTILTYGYWQRRFGGAANVIGQPLAIDGTPVEVIGVLPMSFTFPGSNPLLLLPLQLDRADAAGMSFGFQALARLKPGSACPRPMPMSLA